MNKITFAEVESLFFENNRKNGKPMYAVAVIKESSFNKPYTETERSYQFSSDNKAFKDGKIARSIFSNCLDGKDLGVRLDWYLDDGWDIDYCYLVKGGN